MCTDELEPGVRSVLFIKTNREPRNQMELEAEFGEESVFDQRRLESQFDVMEWIPPFVRVRRKSDGVVGTLMWQHSPRLYFVFKED